MNPKSQPTHRAAEGWWSQQGIGRQHMDMLRISLSATTVSGSGVDCVGMFMLHGSRNEADLFLTKEYLGKHRVEYTGTFDGKRRLSGTWHLEGMQGPWEILLRDGEDEQRSESEDAELENTASEDATLEDAAETPPEEQSENAEVAPAVAPGTALRIAPSLQTVTSD